jgi:YggT family protein
MIAIVLLVFFDLFVKLFNILIIIRILTSWAGLDPQANVLVRLVYDWTEPVLAPIRRLLPQSGALDLAPMVAVLGLYLLHFLLFGG